MHKRARDHKGIHLVSVTSQAHKSGSSVYFRETQALRVATARRLLHTDSAVYNYSKQTVVL